MTAEVDLRTSRRGGVRWVSGADNLWRYQVLGMAVSLTLEFCSVTYIDLTVDLSPAKRDQSDAVDPSDRRRTVVAHLRRRHCDRRRHRLAHDCDVDLFNGIAYLMGFDLSPGGHSRNLLESDCEPGAFESPERKPALKSPGERRCRNGLLKSPGEQLVTELAGILLFSQYVFLHSVLLRFLKAQGTEKNVEMLANSNH